MGRYPQLLLQVCSSHNCWATRARQPVLVLLATRVIPAKLSQVAVLPWGFSFGCPVKASCPAATLEMELLPGTSKRCSGASRDSSRNMLSSWQLQNSWKLHGKPPRSPSNVLLSLRCKSCFGSLGQQQSLKHKLQPEEPNLSRLIAGLPLLTTVSSP